MILERYDRQSRITNWNQDTIDHAVLTILGKNRFSNYLAISAAALGIGRIQLIHSSRDPAQPPQRVFNLQTSLAALLKKINPLVHFENYELPFCVPAEEYFLQEATCIVDATQRYEAYGVSATHALKNSKPLEIIKFFSTQQKNVGDAFITINRDEEHPQKLETYRGQNLEDLDDITAMLAAGVVLEEIKQALFKQQNKRSTLRYELPYQRYDFSNLNVLVVGAGALGNIVVPELALLGVRRITSCDPDSIETVNLNRQIFLYDAVGQPKATILAERAQQMCNGVAYRGIVDKFTENTSLDGYHVVFDCVDNFATRLVLSEACYRASIPLISGGTNYHSGQVITQIPKKTLCTKHTLNLEKVVEQQKEQQPQGCLRQPDPSVIMSNQIIASLMVHAFRQCMLDQPFNGIIKYDARSPDEFGTIPLTEYCTHD